MTMLLDGRLRDLATQTHLLETNCSTVSWASTTVACMRTVSR